MRLKTPPTPFAASASVIWPSESNCICSSFSVTVILASNAFTRASTGWWAGGLLAVLLAVLAASVAPLTNKATGTTANATIRPRRRKCFTVASL